MFYVTNGIDFDWERDDFGARKNMERLQKLGEEWRDPDADEVRGFVQTHRMASGEAERLPLADVVRVLVDYENHDPAAPTEALYFAATGLSAMTPAVRRITLCRAMLAAAKLLDRMEER